MNEIKNILQEFYDGYNAIITSFNIENGNEKALDLVKKMQFETDKCIQNCKNEIENNDKNQMKFLDKIAALYEEIEHDQKRISDLDAELLGITAEIAHIEDDIKKNKSEIESLQSEIRKRDKERKYWENVWWATCWIPFANIGTGIKSINESDEYSIRAKQVCRNIILNEERLRNLNMSLESVKKRQRENNESSADLTNSLTALEGSISFITEKINYLRAKISILRKILEFCSYFEVTVSYEKNILKFINDNLNELNIIRDEIMSVPVTDKYIMGCIWKGDSLYYGQKLNQNEYLLSENGRFAAVMQSDNNFVVYNSDRPIWASGTYGALGKGYIQLNTENGLISLNGTNKSWNSKRNGAIRFTMQNDGNLVAYTKDNASVWATDTYTYSNIASICFNKFIE